MIPFGSALKCSFTIARDSTRKVMSFLDCVPFFRSHDLNHKICRMVRLNIAAHLTDELEEVRMSLKPVRLCKDDTAANGAASHRDHRKPIENQGTAAMTTMPITRASI